MIALWVVVSHGCHSVWLQKEANVIHIASSVGSVKTLQLLVVDRPPPLIQDQLKELFMATDKVSSYSANSRQLYTVGSMQPKRFADSY